MTHDAPAGNGRAAQPAALPPPRACALDVTVRRMGSSQLLIVVGEVDLTTHAVLVNEITRGLDTRPEALVLDLNAVTFLGSVGLAALIDAHRRGAPDTAVRIVAAGRAPLRALRMTGLDQLLSIYPTVERALAAT